VDVDIHTFKEHNVTIPPAMKKPNIIIHTEEELKIALQYVKEANKVLKRSIPPGYVRKLLCRNYYQIEHSDCVIATCKLNPNDTVDGGTGWAVQMAIMKKIPVYIFDIRLEKWMRLKDGYIICLGANELPDLSLYDNITGIGSRDVTYPATKEIIKLFEIELKRRSENE